MIFGTWILCKRRAVWIYYEKGEQFETSKRVYIKCYYSTKESRHQNQNGTIDLRLSVACPEWYMLHVPGIGDLEIRHFQIKFYHQSLF